MELQPGDIVYNIYHREIVMVGTANLEMFGIPVFTYPRHHKNGATYWIEKKYLVRSRLVDMLYEEWTKLKISRRCCEG